MASTIIAITFLVGITCFLFISVESQSRTSPPKTLVPIKRKDEFGFRVVPWCVNGAEEPEFQRYPLSEFKRFLDRDFKFHEGNAAFKYDINLFPIGIQRNEQLGDSDNIQNTVHFQFKSTKRREYNVSVLPAYGESTLEGLIVQPVFAPMGVGLPTGTFIDSDEFNCYDCQYPTGQVVGCKKKTWLNFMHPNILVFHHKMKASEFRKEESSKFCEDQKIRKYCFNGTLLENNTCMTDDACSHLNASSCLKRKTEYECDPGQSDSTRPPTLTSCTDTTGGPDNTKCKSGESCIPKVFNEDIIPNIFCEEIGDYYEPSPEVHGNFIWYTQPCHYTRRIRFLFMAVHSFYKGIYSIQQSGEFVLPPVGNKNHNKFVPGPIFTGFRHICEPSTNKNQKFTNKKSVKVIMEINNEEDFDYSVSYDKCIRYEGDGVSPPACYFNYTDKDSNTNYIPSPRVALKNKNFTPPARCQVKGGRNDDYQYDRDVSKLNPNVQSCKGVCPDLITTTTSGPTRKLPEPFIKRSFHGGINFVTNFCIMPICVVIARFYKETFNLTTLKGNRLWYWAHMIGAGGSSVLMYIGYFHKKLVEDSNPHVAVGNLYIVFLIVSYVSSWIRHKKPRYTTIAEIVHGSSGYACFGLAIVSMLTAPNLGSTPKVFIYCSIGCLALFYIGMTCHVCALDKKFGMQPARRHFPTVEAKFDGLPVPNSGTRTICLVVLSIAIFVCTLGTLVFK